jgi:hypothetical protein
MPTKTTQEVLAKAVQSKGDLVEFFKKLLNGWGDEVDQLRVFGHMCQAGVDLAQAELEQLKLQDEQEKCTAIVIANN